MKVMVMGDTHAEWGPLNVVLNKKRPDILLQCGDFGWWRPFHGIKDKTGDDPFDQYGIKNHKTKIYWCPGNHEHWWDLLQNFTDDGPQEVMPNVYYMKRGTTLTLPDGRNVLSHEEDAESVGGSRHNQRQEGVDPAQVAHDHEERHHGDG